MTDGETPGDEIVWCVLHIPGTGIQCYDNKTLDQCKTYGESMGYDTDWFPIPYDNEDPDAKPPGCGKTNCDVTWLLAMLVPLAALDAARVSMTGFRDLLQLSEFGRRMVSYYYDPEIAGELRAIARANPETWREMAAVILLSAQFATSVLRAYREDSTEAGQVFRRELFDRLCKIGDRVRRESSNPLLLAALADVQNELKRFVGLSAMEAYAVLSRGASREPTNGICVEAR